MKLDLLTALKQYEKRGKLGSDEIVELGEQYGRSIVEVLSLSTFYSQTSSPREGKYKINICRSLPCKMKNMDDVLAVLREEFGLFPECHTEDGIFSLHLANCIGACDRAPAMLVNDRLYGELTPQKVRKILKSLQHSRR